MLVLYQAILAVKTSNGQGKAGQGGGEFRFRQSPVGATFSLLPHGNLEV